MRDGSSASSDHTLLRPLNLFLFRIFETFFIELSRNLLMIVFAPVSSFSQGVKLLMVLSSLFTAHSSGILMTTFIPFLSALVGHLYFRWWLPASKRLM